MSFLKAVISAHLAVLTVLCLDQRPVGAADSLPQDSKTAVEFVRVSSRDPRYFELTDGRPYIPIGLNMIAPPANEGLPGLETWMEQLQANGGNYIRVWLSNPFFDIEHAHCGEYDESKAKRIDSMLAVAARHGIRVKLCLEHFRHLGDGRQAWAGKPLHLVANGGTATNISDFFNGTASREQFKRKLAWFARRIGDNPTVFGWELWNEINAVQGGDYLGWTEIMLPELHHQDTNGVLLHDVLFAPFFAGAAGPGHIWHWDYYVAQQNLWWHFGRFAEAVKDLDPPAEHFEPELLAHSRLRVYVLKGQRTALLWCRDAQNTWRSELAEGKAPDPVEGAVLALGPLRIGKASAQIYDPWNNRWAPAVLNGNQLRLPLFKRSLVVRLALGLGAS